jgi:hypothetical protein
MHERYTNGQFCAESLARSSHHHQIPSPKHHPNLASAHPTTQHLHEPTASHPPHHIQTTAPANRKPLAHSQPLSLPPPPSTAPSTPGPEPGLPSTQPAPVRCMAGARPACPRERGIHPPRASRLPTGRRAWRAPWLGRVACCCLLSRAAAGRGAGRGVVGVRACVRARLWRLWTGGCCRWANPRRLDRRFWIGCWCWWMGRGRAVGLDGVAFY